MTFEVGDKVRVKEESLPCYLVEFQKKVSRGRVGVVVGYTKPRQPSDSPLVEFPECGRRKLYRPGRISRQDLELVVV